MIIGGSFHFAGQLLRENTVCSIPNPKHKQRLFFFLSAARQVPFRGLDCSAQQRMSLDFTKELLNLTDYHFLLKAHSLLILCFTSLRDSCRMCRSCVLFSLRLLVYVGDKSSALRPLLSTCKKSTKNCYFLKEVNLISIFSGFAE